MGICNCLIGGVEGLSHYIMKDLSLVRTEILIVLINLVEVLWCSSGLDTTPSCLFLIGFIYDFINVIYNADLYRADFSVVKCHTEVVVNLASVDGHFS